MRALGNLAVLAGMLGWLTGPGCTSGATDPAPAQGASLSGRITLNGTPYAGATARLTGPRTDSVATGVDGIYRFESLAVGEYTVGIEGVPSAAEFAALEYPVSIASASESVVQDFAGTLVVGAVTGTITVEGTALGGVSARLTGAELQRSALSNPRGEFRFADVPVGTYLVSMTPPAGTRFASTTRQVVLDSTSLEAAVSFTGIFLR